MAKKKETAIVADSSKDLRAKLTELVEAQFEYLEAELYVLGMLAEDGEGLSPCTAESDKKCLPVVQLIRKQIREHMAKEKESATAAQVSSLKSLWRTVVDKYEKWPSKGAWYIGYWWREWSGWYLGAQILGVQFDEEKLALFVDWNERASCWMAYKGLCIVSRNPTQVHWQEQVLHNEAGPAVEYADGWAHYAVGGVAVNEQIVMRPETQTLEQIRSERNEEVKRIRIERYGWELYIKKIGAKVVHTRVNDVDGTHEVLYEMEGGMRAFHGSCISTGREYFLEVPVEIKTCEAAQVWMMGEPGNIIGAS